MLSPGVVLVPLFAFALEPLGATRPPELLKPPAELLPLVALLPLGLALPFAPLSALFAAPFALALPLEAAFSRGAFDEA